MAVITRYDTINFKPERTKTSRLTGSDDSVVCSINIDGLIKREANVAADNSEIHRGICFRYSSFG
jgi:hypothetical protein